MSVNLSVSSLESSRESARVSAAQTAPQVAAAAAGTGAKFVDAVSPLEAFVSAVETYNLSKGEDAKLAAAVKAAREARMLHRDGLMAAHAGGLWVVTRDAFLAGIDGKILTAEAKKVGGVPSSVRAYLTHLRAVSAHVPLAGMRALSASKADDCRNAINALEAAAIAVPKTVAAILEAAKALSAAGIAASAAAASAAGSDASAPQAVQLELIDGITLDALAVNGQVSLASLRAYLATRDVVRPADVVRRPRQR